MSAAMRFSHIGAMGIRADCFPSITFGGLRNRSDLIDLAENSMTNSEALVALNMVEHVGPVRLRQLLEYFSDAASILQASRDRLMHIHGISVDTAEAIANWERSVDLSGELRRIQDF